MTTGPDGWQAAQFVNTDGATLDELAEFVADLRRRNAPGNVCPGVSVNGRGEIVTMTCHERQPS